jgi:hypothetical protein
MPARDDRNGARVAVVRRIGLWALILCTTCLAIENTLLLTWAAASRPWALLTAALAAFKVVCALCVPLGLVLATVALGWLLPLGGAREAGTEDRAAVNGGRHE